MAVSRMDLATGAGGARQGRRFAISAISPNSRYYPIRHIAENPAAVVSVVVLLVIVVAAVFAPLIAPFDPNYVNPATVSASPRATTGSARMISGATSTAGSSTARGCRCSLGWP